MRTARFVSMVWWLGAAATLAAQAAPHVSAPQSVQMLLHGVGAVATDDWRLVRSTAQLRDAASAWAVDVAAVEVEAGAAVLLVAHGDGPAGEPQCLLGRWGADASMRLLRLSGSDPKRRERGRWVLLRVPASWHEAQDHLRVERDVVGNDGLSRWRAVGERCRPEAVQPLQRWSVRGRVPPTCLQEVASWQRFAREHLDAATELPDCDFATHVLLVLPVPKPESGAVTTVVDVRQVRTAAATLLRLDQPLAEARSGSAMLLSLPRVVGELVLEAADPEHDGCLRTIETVRVDAASSLCALRWRALALPPRNELCERSATLPAWLQMRNSLGGAALSLDERWCDFEHEALLVIVLPKQRSMVGAHLDVGTEEGVDVLTITTADGSSLAAEQSACFLLAVSRRPGQTAVVLRANGAAAERTLAVFPGF